MQYIYALADPHTKAIRYVGKTNNLERRYYQHCNTDEDTPKGVWIQDLRQEGYAPAMLLLEEVEHDSDVAFREKFWISVGEWQGWPLTNVANPTGRKPDLSQMFVASLRYEYEVYQQAIKDQAPLVMITRHQWEAALVGFQLLLSGVLGIAAGFAAWYLEYDLSNAWLAALWQAVTIGLSVMIIAASALLGSATKTKWLPLLYASSWFLICVYLVVWN